MPGGGAWVPFLATIVPLVVTPGASLTLLVQRVTADGRRQALPVVAGTVTALAVYTAVVLAGMSLLVAPPGILGVLLRSAGAAYLVGLGCWMWRSADAPAADDGPGRPPSSRRSSYVQALLGTVLNPKAALIYLTVVPRFVDPTGSRTAQLLALAGTHAALTASWLTVWTALLGPAGRLTRSGPWRSRVTRASAVVLLALGVRWLVG
ncbi:LysE family translocator [Cellulomonas sp. URHB0016]